MSCGVAPVRFLPAQPERALQAVRGGCAPAGCARNAPTLQILASRCAKWLNGRSGTTALSILGMRADFCPTRAKLGRSRPTLAESGSNSPERVPKVFELAQTRSRVGRNVQSWSNSAQTWLVLGKHGPELVQVRPHFCKTWPEVGQVRHELAQLGQNLPRIGERLPEFGQIWPDFDRICLHSAKSRLARVQPNLGHLARRRKSFWGDY